MRRRFDEQLFMLNADIIEMGALCEEAITLVLKALVRSDGDRARKVKKDCNSIKGLEREIEQNCMKLLLHQQPVARDLREISSSLRVIADMERIGDHVEDVAQIVIYQEENILGAFLHIEDMGEATKKMVSKAVDAFVKKDVVLADEVIEFDDVVDDYFKKMKYGIIKMIKENPEDDGFALDMLMISKYFERIGDRAVNIAQWVIYAVTGVHKDEN